MYETYNTFEPAQAVLTLYRRCGTWRAVAHVLGSYSASYWDKVAKGMRPSRRAEAILRRRFGLSPIQDMKPAALSWMLRHRVEV